MFNFPPLNNEVNLIISFAGETGNAVGIRTRRGKGAGNETQSRFHVKECDKAGNKQKEKKRDGPWVAAESREVAVL